MKKTHQYEVTVHWTGNNGKGTSDYKSYERSHSITGVDKLTEILGSSDAAFRGDKQKYNPEELLVSAISSCHLLWYLHLCAVNQVVVVAYTDKPIGIMIEDENGSGRFSEVTLYPIIQVAHTDMVEKAHQLHEEAHRLCFIANSCNFPIKHQPQIVVG